MNNEVSYVPRSREPKFQIFNSGSLSKPTFRTIFSGFLSKPLPSLLLSFEQTSEMFFQSLSEKLRKPESYERDSVLYLEYPKFWN